MPAGRLTERVAFDAPSGTTDAFGGTSDAWTAGDPVPAQWIFQRGDEAVQAARLAGRQIFKIKVRSSAATRAVTTDYRMRDVRRGTTWNITNIDAITDRQWVYLEVEGKVSS